MPRRLAVTLEISDELAALLDQAVASRVYDGVDAVVLHALEQLQIDRWIEALPPERTDDLRRSLAATEEERLAGGGHDIDDVFDEVLADLERRYPEAAE